MSEFEKSQPKAWLCKHCSERVDPTMAMCWKCGRDREGDPCTVESFTKEVEQIGVAGIDGRCRRCDYDMRGNSAAKSCPECGFTENDELYATVVVIDSSPLLVDAQKALSLYRLRRVIVMLVLLGPGCFVTGYLHYAIDRGGQHQLADSIAAIYIVVFVVVFVELLRSMLKKASDFLPDTADA